MPTEPRPLETEEEELLAVLQPLMRGDVRALPDACEIEPGYFLRLILDKWSAGGGRDGRKKHLTDSDIAEELARRTGERFDRNRYQATFGIGKKMADGTPQPQPVARPVAKALLEIAFKNWDRPPKESAVKAPDTTPFAQLDPALLDIAIETALKAMYAGNKEVRCRKVVGLGWNGLYRALGAEGSTVVVIARDDALRMNDPDEDIFTLSRILNLLLCQDKSRSVGAHHIWAIRRPDRHLDRTILVRELDGIGTLKSKLQTIEYLNHIAPVGWTSVDLERCLIAEAATYSAHSDLFDLGVSNRLGADGEPAREPIAVLAVSPDREVRFFTFSLERSLPVAPFVRRIDLPVEVEKQILELVDAARGACTGEAPKVKGDWHFHRALDFASGWVWHIEKKENR